MSLAILKNGKPMKLEDALRAKVHFDPRHGFLDLKERVDLFYIFDECKLTHDYNKENQMTVELAGKSYIALEKLKAVVQQEDNENFKEDSPFLTMEIDPEISPTLELSKNDYVKIHVLLLINNDNPKKKSVTFMILECEKC